MRVAVSLFSLAFSLFAISAIFALKPVLAQERESARWVGIEEIIVHARKREEELQSVPLSITAFDGETISSMYGANLGEFSKYTPNVQLARQPYAGNALFGGMRGIVFGDLEKSFDPAVGVVVDGVALVNNTGALIDTFDLESVEILRGPQGTLFGRNTIAGVVNARRSQPTGEFGLKTQVRYGSYNEIDLKAVLNFAASDEIAVKIAAFRDKGDGFQEKATFDLATGAIDGTGDQIDGEDTLNLYASVLWEPNDRFSAQLTLDYTDDESVLATPTNLTTPGLTLEQRAGLSGALLQGVTVGASAAAAAATAAAVMAATTAGMPPPTLDELTAIGAGASRAATVGAVGGAIGGTLGSGGNFCDVYAVLAPINSWAAVPEVGCSTYGSDLGERTGYEYSITAQDFINEIESKGYTLELNYDFGRMDLTSITSYKESEELLDEDNLGAPVEIFNPYRPQEFDQLSTELRLNSNLGGNLEFQVGLYYLDSSYDITAKVWSFGALGSTRESGGTPTTDTDAGQDLTAYALFGELYYDISDQARLTLGGRWTREEKEFFTFYRVSGSQSLPREWGCGNLSGSQQAVVDAAGTTWIDQATATVGVPKTDTTPEVLAVSVEEARAARTAALVCQDDDGKETWSEFTPRISLDYQFSEDIMAYGSYSKGFRSGGWNGRASTPSSIGPYEPETVNSFELGLRMVLLDDTLLANLTLFRSVYEDKHESNIYAFGSATETVVNNAAEATIDGLEFEARYLLTDNFQLRMAVGYLNGEYDEFLVPVNSADRAGPRMDIANQYAFAFAPDYTISLGFEAFYPLSDDYGSLQFNGNYAWADSTVGNFGLPDPQGLGRNEFPNRETVDLSLTWQNQWVDVALYGRNLTEDDNYLTTAVDVGVFYFGAVAQGRTWGIEVTKAW